MGTMDDISALLLGPQRGSHAGVVFTVIAVAVAGALIIYLLRCYVQESLFRKRVKQRVHQQWGGNTVPAEAAPGARVLSETRRLGKKSSRALPRAQRATDRTKVRRHGIHPWKQNMFSADLPTPH